MEVSFARRKWRQFSIAAFVMLILISYQNCSNSMQFQGQEETAQADSSPQVPVDGSVDTGITVTAQHPTIVPAQAGAPNPSAPTTPMGTQPIGEPEEPQPRTQGIQSFFQIGSNQFTVPPNVHKVRVTLVGGGGTAGESHIRLSNTVPVEIGGGAGSGGNGGISQSIIKVTPGEVLDISIGAAVYLDFQYTQNFTFWISGDQARNGLKGNPTTLASRGLIAEGGFGGEGGYSQAVSKNAMGGAGGGGVGDRVTKAPPGTPGLASHFYQSGFDWYHGAGGVSGMETPWGNNSIFQRLGTGILNMPVNGYGCGWGGIASGHKQIDVGGWTGTGCAFVEWGEDVDAGLYDRIPKAPKPIVDNVKYFAPPDTQLMIGGGSGMNYAYVVGVDVSDFKNRYMGLILTKALSGTLELDAEGDEIVHRTDVTLVPFKTHYKFLPGETEKTAHLQYSFASNSQSPNESPFLKISNCSYNGKPFDCQAIYGVIK